MACVKVRVQHIRDEAKGIKAFELVAALTGALPPFQPGAHVVVHLPNGLARQYSLVNDCREFHKYEIAVLREPDGRGGSRFMHDNVREGDVLSIDGPANNFPLRKEPSHYVLIAGGIGITPILSMARFLENSGKRYILHYCTRSPERTAYKSLLERPPFASRVRIYHDYGNPADGLDVAGLLCDRPEDAEVYCCGPAGLISAVRTATSDWPPGTVHFEYFAADPALALNETSNRSFQVVIARTGAVYEVPPDKSILDVLLAHGIEVAHLCQEGYCGSCITSVLDGIPDHRDTVLDHAEKAGNRLITVCCSRAKSDRLVLDL